jgi:hypothetical protein
MFVAPMDLTPGKLCRSVLFNAPPHCAPLELSVIGGPLAINISALRAFAQAASRALRKYSTRLLESFHDSRIAHRDLNTKHPTLNIQHPTFPAIR